MKTILSIFLSLIAGACLAQNNVIQVPVANYMSQPRPGATVTWQLVSPNPRVGPGGAAVQVNPVAAVADAGGTAWFTNMQWGWYSVSVGGAAGTTYPYVVVQPASTGAVAFAQLIWSHPPFASELPPNPLSNYLTEAQSDARYAQAGAISTNYDALGSANAATNALAPSAWGNASGLTSGTLPSAQLPSSVIQQNQNNDANLNGGLAVRRGLSVLPTTKNDGLEVDIVTPGSVANPIGARDTNNVLRFNIDSNFVAHGDGGGLTNINATNISVGTVPLAAMGNGVTNHDVRSTQIAADFHVTNSFYGGTSFCGPVIGNEVGYDAYQGNPRYTLGNSVGAVGFVVYPYNQTLYYSWMDGPMVPYYGDWRITAYLGAANAANAMFPGSFAGSIFPKADTTLSIPNGGQALGGGPASAYGKWAGNGSQLAGMPPSPQETVPALPIPPIVLCVDNNSATATNENACTNVLAIFRAAGIQAALTNAGVPLVLFVQDFNFYFASNRDVNGNLFINTNNYPDSTNFASIVHGYGAKLMVQQYFHDWNTNQFTEWGGGVVNGYPGIPVITPNTYLQDCSHILDFGVDGICFADDNSNLGVGYEYDRRPLIEATLNPILESGTQSAKPYSFSTVLGGKGMTNSPVIGFYTPRISQSCPESFYGNLLWHDTDDTWPGIITSYPDIMVWWMNKWRAVFRYEVPYLASGHYAVGESFNAPNDVDLNLNQDRALFALTAVGLTPPQVAFAATNTASSFVRLFTNYLQCVTNSTFLKVYGDTLCNKPIQLVDNGATNVSAWGKVLRNGAFGVAVENEAPISSNISFTMPSLGCDPSKFYCVWDAWSNTLSAPIPGTSSFTFQNLQSYQGDLLYVYPTNLNTTYYSVANMYTSQSGTVVPWSALPTGQTKSYVIPAGSTFVQGLILDNAEKFSPYTNFLVTAQVFTTNSGTLLNALWNFCWQNKQGQNGAFGPNTSYTFTNGFNAMSQTFSVSPTNSGQLVQFFATFGPGSQSFATNIWLTGFEVTPF